VERPDQPELLEVLRGLGRTTTPERLLERGLTRVRSIGVAELALLVEKAVNRTFLARTIGHLGEDELAELVGQARTDLARQIAASRDLADSRDAMQRHRQRIQAELAALRTAIAARRDALGTAEGETTERWRTAQERRNRIRHRLQALMLPLHGPTTDPAIARSVLAEVFSALDESEAAVVAEERRAIDGELDVLERRIAKLIAELAEAERALERVAHTKDVELGLSSGYRTVQGMDDDASDREAKLAMLARIFRLNLEFQARDGGVGLG
jgi:hypothetical protein